MNYIFKRLAAGTVILCFCAGNAFANNVNVSVNGKKLSDSSFIKDGVTYVPLREAAEALGANVAWNAATSEVNVTFRDASQVFNLVGESVVAIAGNYKQGVSFEASQYKDSTAHGTGVVIKSNGTILTNAHVVDEAAKLVVEVNDYEDDSKTYEYEATVIGSDTSTDIAVIKIDRSEKFIAAKIGDSDSLKVGQEVCAIGNPGVTGDIMFAHTMTKGIVSGLNRVCLSEGYNLSLIQTDTAINSGNSGGGLFDMYGNVVGVVNSKIVTDTFEGIGFALTINEAKPVMEDLLSYGYVKSRPVLGITTVELNEYRAQLYGVKLTKGLLVSDIREDAPVSRSGLRVSDVITKINGTNVETVADVQSIIGKLHVGDKITATVARANESGTLDSVDIEIELAESSQ